MKATHQRSLPSNGLAVIARQRNLMNRLKSSVPRCSLEIHNPLSMNEKGICASSIKHRHFVNDHTNSYFSPITPCRKFMQGAQSQFCPENGETPCEEEGFFQKEGFSVTRFTAAILGLMGTTAGRSQNVGFELMVLTFPAIVGQMIEPLSQLMETAFIGRLGAVELASAGVAVSVFNIISKLFNIPLLSITTSFVAEDISLHASNEAFLDRVSQKDNSGAIIERMQLPSVSTALLLAFGIGVIEALALFFGSGLFLNMMGISSASKMHYSSRSFLSLRAIGAPAVVVSLAVQGVFRGFKDTSTPLFCLGIGNLSAVLLLPLLIYYFHLGTAGAAIAMVTSQYIITFLLIWFLNKRVILLPPNIEDLQFGGYIKSGGFLIGRTLAVLITMTLGTSMAAQQGPLAMAAHQICLQVWLAVSLLSDALAVSGQALIARAFSKRDYRKVKEITFWVLKACLFTGVLLALILSFYFGSLAGIFTKDPGVLGIVRSGVLVLFVSASQPINALAFVFDGLHYGVSDFSFAAYSMMLVGAISSVFLLYAPCIFGLPGVWLGLVLFMSLRVTAGVFRLGSRKGPWWFLWGLDTN